MDNMDTSKTPPPKRKARASLGTAIKRSIQTTRAGKKRRVVVATQKNIARALNNEKLDSNETQLDSSVYEGRITRARNATLRDAPKETPSRMLRQLSKVLPRPPEHQTPRRNATRTGAQRTPGSIRLTPNSTKRSTKKSNNISKSTVATKKQSPQDLLRQLTRAPGFVQVPQDYAVKIGASNISPDDDKFQQENDLLEPRQNNVQMKQSIEDCEPIDIETQLHDKMDNSDDEIPNCFDQITETMEFTGEVITDRNNMDIEFNNQVRIQPPDEIFNRFDNNENVDTFNSSLAGSSGLQEGSEFDNFWLGRNFNGIGINENSERRHKLLNELLRSSLEYDSVSHDNSLEEQSNERRVQPLFNSKRYDTENIIPLDLLVDEIGNEHDNQLEINSKHDDVHAPKATIAVDDKSYHKPENYIEIIQNESDEMPQEELVIEPEFNNDHLNLEQGLNDIRKNKRTRTNKPAEIARLPNSLIKSLFSKFSNIKVSKDAVQAVFHGIQEYFEQISNDLNTYASHAKREVIQEKDVLLLMKRQGLITEKTTFESLVEQYLPRELSDEICPYARAGNTVYPQKQLLKKGMEKARAMN